MLGNLAFSHEIIHQIGGRDDTNSNTTKRILLLLEGRAAGRHDALDRELNSILERYISEDARFPGPGAVYRVPRFPVNDFARLLADDGCGLRLQAQDARGARHGSGESQAADFAQANLRIGPFSLLFSTLTADAVRIIGSDAGRQCAL